MIAARALMGVGAAFVLPLSLTMVTDAFPGADRGRAMGIWAAVSSLALAIGADHRRRARRDRLAG